MRLICITHKLIKIRHKSVFKIIKSRFRIRISTKIPCYLGLSYFVSKLIIIRSNSIITNLSNIIRISNFSTKHSKVLTTFFQTEESFIKRLNKVRSHIVNLFTCISFCKIILFNNIFCSIKIKNFYISRIRINIFT